MELFFLKIWSGKTPIRSFGLIVLFFWMQSILLSGGAYAQSCNTTGVLLEWNFNSTTVQCNGAVGYPDDLTTPWLKAGKRWYCPNINAGCGKGLLGSKGHANTDQFEQAICLLGFQNNTEALNRGGCPYDGNSTIFDPNQCNNLMVEYIIPAGKAACLSDFSLNIIQKQVSTLPNFEMQGVGVKRNGVLIYSQTQSITSSHINNPANPMVFSFTGSQFCTDGSAEVKFEIVFGLVHKLIEFPKPTGYDNIKLNGSCGGPGASAEAKAATCGTSGPLNNGQIVLSGFQASDHYDYNAGSSYIGTATYATATTIPVNGVIVNNLPDLGIPKTYTVRIFSSSGCFTDKTVTLTPALCPPPSCTKPSAYTVTSTDATCSTNTANNDAKIAVSGVTNGNRVGISLGSTYNGPSYAAANNLTAGAFMFTGLTNPNGIQIYTIRIFNGNDGCFIDETKTIAETSCGPCKKATVEICASGAFDPDSKPSNGVSTEDDLVTYDLCKDTKFIDLELTKAVSPASGTTCPTNTNFTWTLTMSNKGTMTAKNIQVSDLVPDDLVVVSTTATKGHFGALSGWLLDSLQANETVTATMVTKALKAGTYTNCAEINAAFPLNDIDSTPGNNSTTEDDDACATITVTGSNPPVVEKGFSPMLTKPNVATRMTIKIFNNSTSPITLTAPFVDNLPSSPGQMKIAATPHLVSSISGVTAIANDTKLTIPSGSTLLPGLNQIQVDVIMPTAGTYCNSIVAGSLKTSQCDNVLPDTACAEANSTFVIAPIISKSFSPAAVNTNTNSTLTLVVENRNTVSMTLLSDFNDRLPTGLVVAGTATSTCGTVTAVTGSGIITLASGTVLAAGTCTISVPVKSTTAGIYCNLIPMNAMMVDIGGQMTGNEDLAEACLTVTQTPCTAIDVTSITTNPAGSITSGGTVILTANSTGSGSSTIYTWSAPSGTFSNTGSNPTVWTAPPTAGTYKVKVVADNSATGYGVCKDSVTLDLIVQAACIKPNAGNDQTVCAGTSAGLTGTAPTTGTWTAQAGNPVGATLGATTGGIATLNFANTAIGTYKFIYTISVGCQDTMSIVVNAKPNIANGAATICAGESVDLTSKITGYATLLSPVWTLATAGGTAVTTPTAVKPTATTTYVLVAQNAAGCKDTANVVVTVNPKPNAGTDQTLACANAATNTLTTSTTLTPTPTGGTWAQIGTAPATATITGNNITGMSVAGTYSFVYTLNGCKDTVAVTVQPCAGCVKPNAGPDAAAVCQPTSTAKLTAVTAGGTWAAQTGNPAVAAIDASGNITGLSAAGTYKFIYSVTGGGIVCTDTAQVVVNAKPNIANGAATICAGESVDLTSKITGYATLLSPVWTLTTAGGTAVTTPTAVKPTATTTYVLVAQNAAGCKDTANVVVTVNPKPNAGTDQTLACANAATNTLTTSTTLTPTPTGGTYTQIGTAPATATITGNNITGMSVAGTYSFVYTLNGCKDTVAVTVQPCAGCVKPNAGPDAAAVCQPTTTAKLTAVTAGGTWSAQTGNPATAAIDASGNITGLSTAGTYKFIYSVTGGGIICTDTAQVIVNAKPNIANGAATICAGETVDLTSKITGYATLLSPVWTLATAGGTAVATPTAVKPTTTTTYVLVAQNAAGCKDTANVVVTVNPKPNAGADIIGANAICSSIGTTTLSGIPSGGTWAQIGTTPSAAVITAAGAVSGLTSAGTYQFIYTLNGCSDTVAVETKNCAKGSLGDLVWKDANDNGIQDLPAEKGVKGVIVQLLSAANNAVLATDTTDAAGIYSFTGLESGDYKVKIVLSSLPDTCQISPKQDVNSGGGNDTNDSDFNPATGESQLVTISTTGTGIAKDNPTVDAALIVPCTKSKITVMAAPVCSADIQTYSLTFSVTNRVGSVKVNKGTLTGSNPYTVTGIPSGATIKITDSLSAVCTFDTLITGPNCNCNPPLPTLVATSLTACIGDTFPTLKATVVGLATVEWFTQASGGSPIFTGLNFKPAGTIPAGGAVFYAQARSTDPACPVAVSTGRVTATIGAQDCTKEVDLALKKSISTKIARIGDVLTYTLKVWNESNTNATGVEVTDSLATTVQFVAGSFASSRGSAVISGNVIQWTIGSIAANGDTVTLTYQVKATQEGIHFNTAEICKTNEKDVDSTPCNHNDDEDDIDHQCFTVPVTLCPTNKVEASIPSKYTNVKWFKDAGNTPIATGNVVLLSEQGTYTFTADNQTCPATGCCPVIIESGTDCCPDQLCVPFTVKKIKK